MLIQLKIHIYDDFLDILKSDSFVLLKRLCFDFTSGNNDLSLNSECSSYAPGPGSAVYELHSEFNDKSLNSECSSYAPGPGSAVLPKDPLLNILADEPKLNVRGDGTVDIADFCMFITFSAE